MALTKAVIVNRDAPAKPPIPVMFNPPNYELSKTNRFAEIQVPGLPSAVLQFVNGDAQTLSMELFFDTTDTGVDVRSRTAAISNLTELDARTHAPPRLLLLWGSLVFPCFLVSVRQQFDYFNALGMPLRARLTVEFRGHDPLETLIASVPIAQVEQAARYVAKAGDTLQGIAATVYGDPGQWRRIADSNRMDNPRAIVAGMRLQIPRLS